MEELNKLSTQLLKLGTNHDWQTADETCKIVSSIFGIDVERFKLWHDPRIVAEASRFMTAFETINNPAAYEVRHSSERAIDIKLYWMKKSTKTNLSWVVGAADNFEDSVTMQHKNIGIDIVVPESCDRIFIIVSNQYKLRVLELHNHLSLTDREILTSVINLKNDNVSSLNEKTLYHNAIWNAFNFEPINKRFYRELVDRFIVLRDHLTLQKNITPVEAVSFTTRLIGRLLFVKFLDKKGLINSSIEYFNAPSGDSKIQTFYYKEKIEALFYKTLNTEISDRDFSDIITPYLNGGLFDASDSDFYNKNIVTFPDNYFSVFQSILAKYNFTVDESSPEFQQVAVDPEMLGRIFESLLGEMETKEGDSLRSATGAFYTPREIVSYMCEQSVLEYLKSKITDSPERDRRLMEIITMSESLFRDQDQNKRRDWKPYAQPILDALEALTVLDPAVGSGAYPMGMLHLLIKIYTRLDSKYEKNLSKLKRDILSRSLYGSDISTTAIEICRLRAWLSLVVDISQGEQVVPLPNLEFHFVCANSLISLNRQSSFNDTADLKDNMKKIREDYYGTNSKKIKETLRKKYEKLLNPSQASLLSENDNILKTYRPFTHESVAGFFDPELMLGKEKFDVVIGNPPYVQIQKFKGQKIQKDLEDQNYKTFRKTGDIYCLFYERGLNLTKNNTGILCYITSNKWMRADYGKELREYFIIHNPIVLLDLGSNIFESATVDSNILLIKNSKNEGKTITLTVRNDKQDLLTQISDLSTINSFKLSGIWFIGTQFELDLKNKLEKKGVPIKNLEVLINKGLMTGCNEAFYIDEDTKNELEKSDKKSLELIFKNFRGREICKYYTKSSEDSYIIVTSNYININDYPAIKNHLLKYEIKLKARAQFIRGDHEWFTVDNCPSEQNLKKYRGPKIIYPNMTQFLSFTIDYSGSFSNDKTFTIVADDTLTKFLCAILNSKLLNTYLKISLPKLGNDGYEVRKVFFENTPIPKITDQNKKDIEEINKLIDQILLAKKENEDADTKQLEKEIDFMVYKLYELIYEEVLIIDKDFSLSKEEYENFKIK